jgi:HK97 family phage portal protein
MVASEFDIPSGDRGAASIPAVVYAVNLIANACAGLAWRAWRGSELLSPQPAIVDRPNEQVRSDEFVQGLVISCLYRGVGYAYLTDHDDRGHPRSGYVIDPDEVDVDWDDETGVRRTFEWRGRSLTLGRTLLELPWTRLPGEARPVGPIELARRTIAGQVTADEFARSLFAEGAAPASVITVPRPLADGEAVGLKTQWMEAHAGPTRTPAILSGGMEYSQVALSPEDAQFLETRGYGVREIGRLYSIPQSFMGEGGSGSSVTYANVQQDWVSLIRQAILPVVTRLEGAWADTLPRGTAVRASFAALERPDPAGIITAGAEAIGAGILTPEQVQAWLGVTLAPQWDPLP